MKFIIVALSPKTARTLNKKKVKKVKKGKGLSTCYSAAYRG